LVSWSLEEPPLFSFIDARGAQLPAQFFFCFFSNQVPSWSNVSLLERKIGQRKEKKRKSTQCISVGKKNWAKKGEEKKKYVGSETTPYIN